MNSESPPIAKPRVAAGVLIIATSGDILLVKPSYKDGWDLPGGYVEPGESPAAAAVRELGEELGLQQQVGRLLVVDWAPHPKEGDKLLFIFAGETVSADDLPSLSLQSDEISGVRYWPVSQVAGITPPRLARRITLAHHVAIHGSATAYAEHGRLISVAAASVSDDE